MLMIKQRIIRNDNCSKCGNIKEENRRKKQGYCLSCHNEYMRANRPKHNELDEIAKKKANCRSYFNVYLRRGKIKKQPCEVCGSDNSQAHHEDYSKPLEVKWLCRIHHLEIHSQYDFT